MDSVLLHSHSQMIELVLEEVSLVSWVESQVQLIRLMQSWQMLVQVMTRSHHLSRTLLSFSSEWLVVDCYQSLLLIAKRL
ncbi:hypothetical protein D3C87_1859480 [compost metagenome]